MPSADSTPAEVFLPFVRERRREARALADWDALRRHRSMPLAEFCDRAPVRSGATTWHVIMPDVVDVSQVREDEDVDLTLLSRAVLDRWVEIAAAARPLRISMRASGKRAWRGMLFPFALRGGGLGAVQAVVTQADAPRMADLAGVRAIVSSVHRTPPRLPSASPWTPGSGAARLLDRVPAPPLALAERLAVARTWAALATGSTRPGQAGHVHAALTGAFDFLLAVRVGQPEMSPSRAAEFVFGDRFPQTQFRHFCEALAQGERLGLDRRGFSALLERFPGGYRGLAMAARAEDSEAGQTLEAPLHQLDLLPVDVSLFSRLARRERHADPRMSHRVAA